MQKYAILLEIDKNRLFPAIKRLYLRLQTSKLKMVESFIKIGKKFLDEELFSSFGAF